MRGELTSKDVEQPEQPLSDSPTPRGSHDWEGGALHQPLPKLEEHPAACARLGSLEQLESLEAWSSPARGSEAPQHAQGLEQPWPQEQASLEHPAAQQVAEVEAWTGHATLKLSQLELLSFQAQLEHDRQAKAAQAQES